MVAKDVQNEKEGSLLSWQEEHMALFTLSASQTQDVLSPILLRGSEPPAKVSFYQDLPVLGGLCKL